ncbi:MAG: F0F1 ATP synthase subunit A [Firmicutes bacterium]|nr:F0F1 ATP synthase subunit A [Candidatus Colimorpha enterica]
MILPFVGCIVLKVLTTPASEGIDIKGAQIYFEIPMPIQPLYITEATVVSAAVIISLLCLVLFITRGLKRDPESKRQIIAEYLVETCDNFIKSNMGESYLFFSPFVAAIMAISAFSSLSSLLGLYPPTSDMSIVGGWAILSFGLITHYKLKGGLRKYIKGFFDPIPIFAPFNIIGEFSTPVSMAFRHYGNVLSGCVVSTLVAAALGGASNLIFSFLPGFLSGIPLLRVGIPAILSVYFDLFSGCMQAFIFAILTMLYCVNGFNEEDYLERMAKKQARKDKKAAKNTAAAK